MTLGSPIKLVTNLPSEKLQKGDLMCIVIISYHQVIAEEVIDIDCSNSFFWILQTFSYLLLYTLMIIQPYSYKIWREPLDFPTCPSSMPSSLMSMFILSFSNCTWSLLVVFWWCNIQYSFSNWIILALVIFLYFSLPFSLS